MEWKEPSAFSLLSKFSSLLHSFFSSLLDSPFSSLTSLSSLFSMEIFSHVVNAYRSVFSLRGGVGNQEGWPGVTMDHWVKMSLLGIREEI